MSDKGRLFFEGLKARAYKYCRGNYLEIIWVDLWFVMGCVNLFSSLFGGHVYDPSLSLLYALTSVALLIVLWCIKLFMRAKTRTWLTVNLAKEIKKKPSTASFVSSTAF